MKQKDGLVINVVNDGFTILDTNDQDVRFNGEVRVNSTIARIMDLLREDLSYDELIDELLKAYDTSRENIENDVSNAIKKLKSIGFIIETDKDKNAQ